MQIFYRRIYTVELNPNFVRVVLLRKRGKRLSMIKSLQKTPEKGQSSFSMNQQLNALRAIIQVIPVDVEDLVVVNYPFDQTLYEHYTMPKLSKDQIKGAIQYKLSEDFSIPSQNIVLDFGEGFGTSGTSLSTGYFVFAAKKAQLELFIQSLVTQGGLSEPDIVMPDLLKYLEILDFQKMGLEELNQATKLHFLVCVDFEYSILFVLRGKEVIRFMDIPISLNRLIVDSEKSGLDPSSVLEAILKGSETGSLGYTQGALSVFENFYKLVGFESEKVTRQYLNTLNESDPLFNVSGVFFCSINQRISLDLEANARDIRILDGISIKRTVIRQDIPDDLDVYRTTLGMGLRGVNTLGRSEFIQKKKR